MTGDVSFESFRAFFNSYFQIFEGKHTDWLLLNEPDMSIVTPQLLNKRYQELIAVINEHFVEPEKKKGQQRDYNRMVELLNDEAMREAQVIHTARIKRQEEKEKRLLRRISKKQEKINYQLERQQKRQRNALMMQED